LSNLIKIIKRVVVLIPVNKEFKFLMQLRDFKSEITAPGQWGFFGGGVEIGEVSIQAAYRELHEELNIQNVNLVKLGEQEKKVSDLPGLYSTAYTFFLNENKSNIKLLEGVDYKFASFNEINSGYIYSNKFKKKFQVVKTKYINKTLLQALEFWKNENKRINLFNDYNKFYTIQ